MSNFSTFALITEGNTSTAPNIFSASTPDNLAAITTAGYLNDISAKVKPNDIIYINYSDTSTFPLNVGESATAAQFMVSYSAPNWTIALLSFPSNVSFASVAITATQLNAMYATPIALVSAPGANKILILDSLELVLTYGSAAFASGGVSAVQWDSTANGAGVIASTTLTAANLQATASTVFTYNRGIVPLRLQPL